jgi:hypothetical protein
MQITGKYGYEHAAKVIQASCADYRATFGSAE